MKIASILFLLLWIGTFFGGDSYGRKSIQVQIVSDTFDKKVPKGKCKITGEVYYMGELQHNAEVCSQKGQECVNTNKKGEFSIMVDTSETNVYATLIGASASHFQGYKYKSQHHLKLRFYVGQKQMNVKKPVIYLYSDEYKELELSLNTDVELSFTYPQYDDSWKVSVNPEVGLSVDGMSYPYLFWEGVDYGNLSYHIEEDKLTGQVIKTDSVIAYLEAQLNQYGLNTAERTDFITFWGPILTKKKYAFVQFVLDEDYDQVAEIESTVDINNERRIFLMYESFEVEPDLSVSGKQPMVENISRKGLTLIEWGGAEVTVPRL